MPQTQQDKLLALLAANGPVEDPNGRVNHILAEAIGCGVGVMTTLLWKLDRDGLIVRSRKDPTNQRSAITSVALADGVTVPTFEQSPMFDVPDELTPIDPDDYLVDEPPPDAGIDYAKLGVVILNEALAAKAAVTKAEEEALAALLRAEELEERLCRVGEEHATTVALLEGRVAEVMEESDRQLKQAHEDALAAVAKATDEAAVWYEQLEAQAVLTAKAEDACATFRKRCEELDAQVTKLKKALAKSEEELQRRPNGYPFRELVSNESRSELAAIMRQAPTVKG